MDRWVNCSNNKKLFCFGIGLVGGCFTRAHLPEARKLYSTNGWIFQHNRATANTTHLAETLLSKIHFQNRVDCQQSGSLLVE
jgi:hypothetical protein